MDKNIRYYYYGRTAQGNKNGIITCSTALHGESIHVGFSFCNPNDSFRKDKGRIISTGRLLSDPVVIPFTGKSGDDISNFIRANITSGKVRDLGWPRWIKRVGLHYSIGFTNNRKDKMSS